MIRVQHNDSQCIMIPHLTRDIIQFPVCGPNSFHIWCARQGTAAVFLKTRETLICVSGPHPDSTTDSVLKQTKHWGQMASGTEMSRRLWEVDAAVSGAEEKGDGAKSWLKRSLTSFGYLFFFNNFFFCVESKRKSNFCLSVMSFQCIFTSRDNWFVAVTIRTDNFISLVFSH